MTKEKSTKRRRWPWIVLAVAVTAPTSWAAANSNEWRRLAGCRPAADRGFAV